MNKAKSSARERTNIQMVQNTLLIWLDNNIDNNNADCRNTISQLRRVTNTISAFTDSEECIQYLKSIGNEKVCMIISGYVGQNIMPYIHNMSQVDSIFIFCGNKKRHEQWTKEWPKIKGIFTDIAPICHALKQAVQPCEQISISISIMGTGDDVSKRKLDQLDPSFMYTEILKEILLSIKFDDHHITESVEYCRTVLVENPGELKNVDLIIKMGFFIDDLHRQMDQLHKDQFSGHKSGENLTVYRGQGMVKVDFEKMMKTKDGLLSFNCFLSTSKNRSVSLSFAHSAAMNPDLVGVFFVTAIDPSISTTPFASITDVSYYGDKELFSVNTVFRIGKITSVDESHRVFQVELVMTSDNDKDLRQLTDHIREDIYPNEEGWQRLGLLLYKMGQPAKAYQVFERLLEQTTDESEKTNIYERLGIVKHHQREYQEAITFYEKALPPHLLSLSHSYNNIGNVYGEMGDYPQALSSHERALAIRQQSLPPNHPDLSSSYSNIGHVYYSMSDYPQALSSHERALEIQQQSLPTIISV